MLSKYDYKNSYIKRKLEEIRLEEESVFSYEDIAFVEIDYKKYDYLIYKEGNQFCLGYESYKKPLIPFLMKGYYYVKERYVVVSPTLKSKKEREFEVLEEMLKIKEKKITFEQSFFYPLFKAERRKVMENVDDIMQRNHLLSKIRSEDEDD